MFWLAEPQQFKFLMLIQLGISWPLVYINLNLGDKKREMSIIFPYKALGNIWRNNSWQNLWIAFTNKSLCTLPTYFLQYLWLLSFIKCLCGKYCPYKNIGFYLNCPSWKNKILNTAYKETKSLGSH